MNRLVPYPVQSALLTILWMVMTRFSLGHLILGGALALLAGWAMSALHPERATPRNWRVVPRLIWTLFWDIIRSNARVTRLLVTEGRNGRRSTFLEVPLRLTSPTGLAVLAIILTATPGTAWVEYSHDRRSLLLHVFDGAETDHYLSVIRDVYEPMLQEIFE